MDTEKLSALISVIESGSLASASKVLQYSQTGMLYTINSLEKSLGVKLLNRSPFGVVPTTVAKNLLPEIRQILHSVRIFEDKLASIKDENSSIIRIATYASTYQHWFPQLIPYLTEKFPNHQFRVKIGNYSAILNWFENKEIDIAVSGHIESSNVALDLMWSPLFLDELFIVAPKHSLDNGFQNMVKSLPYLVTNFHVGNADSSFIHLTSKNIPSTASNTIDLVSLIIQGFGFSILSEITVSNWKSSLDIIPMSPRWARELGVLRLKKPHNNAIFEIISAINIFLAELPFDDSLHSIPAERRV